MRWSDLLRGVAERARSTRRCFGLRLRRGTPVNARRGDLPMPPSNVATGSGARRSRSGIAARAMARATPSGRGEWRRRVGGVRANPGQSRAPRGRRLSAGASASRKALRPHALDLTRRLARHVYVEDLGAVRVLLGNLPVSRTLRRKVLGLLCFLSSRQGMAATRDEALEALWPELGPGTATNSLHQTIYFLRRVFEPGYREGLGAGYVLIDGELVSLNPGLVDSASRECWRILSTPRANDEAMRSG